MIYAYDNWRLKLDRNENLYQASTLPQSAIRNMDFNAIAQYPNYDKIKEKLIKTYNIDSESFFLTNGIVGALKIVFEKFLNVGDEFFCYNLCPDYVLASANNFCKNVRLINHNDELKFNYDDFLNNIQEKTKIAYLSTPDIITGEYVALDYIKSLVEKRPDTLFLVDCSYINFVIDSSFSDFTDLTKNHKNVIFIKSFSVDYALSGLDCAIIVSNSEVMRDIKKTVYYDEINVVSQLALNSVLNDSNYILELQKYNEASKDLLFKGLEELNYKPYKSHTNFILCDFKNHCDFCYDKLKKNGILTKRFPKNSVLSNHLQITLPKESGVRYVLEILSVKDLLIFDLDGIILNDFKSFVEAIKKTYNHFSNKNIELAGILRIKNTNKALLDWQVVDYLLKEEDIFIDENEIINVFQDFLNNKEDFLIDKDELIIPKAELEKLVVDYDLAILTKRNKSETFYSLQKFEIEQYFYYILTSTDWINNKFEPYNKALEQIVNCVKHKNVKFFASCVDDIIAGNALDVETIAVLKDYVDDNTMVNNFKHLGVKTILPSAKVISPYLADERNSQAGNVNI